MASGGNIFAFFSCEMAVPLLIRPWGIGGMAGRREGWEL